MHIANRGGNSGLGTQKEGKGGSQSFAPTIIVTGPQPQVS